MQGFELITFQVWKTMAIVFTNGKSSNLPLLQPLVSSPSYSYVLLNNRFSSMSQYLERKKKVRKVWESRHPNNVGPRKLVPLDAEVRAVTQKETPPSYRWFSLVGVVGKCECSKGFSGVGAMRTSSFL